MISKCLNIYYKPLVRISLRSVLVVSNVFWCTAWLDDAIDCMSNRLSNLAVCKHSQWHPCARMLQDTVGWQNGIVDAFISYRNRWHRPWRCTNSFELNMRFRKNQLRQINIYFSILFLI